MRSLGTGGSPKTYVKVTSGGATSHQQFCPECASPIYSTAPGAGPRIFNFRLGTVRQRAQLQPRAQYGRRSAQDWAAMGEPCGRIETQWHLVARTHLRRPCLTCRRPLR
ncbi:GFA family protein [Dongia sp.]|uniref:GFA family protein n=1 Tax=Dongia sp. TaxID=1977262 RepID=UPI0035B085D7